jgi:RimJ/RimL family protein N-acetyltransferase
VPVLTPVVLTTPRLRLRPPEPADAAALLAVFADPAVTRYWSSPPWTAIDQAEAQISADAADLAEGTAMRLAIVPAVPARAGADGPLLGTVSLFHLDPGNRRAEIGYALGRPAWGQGYGQEAVRALVGHAFGALDLNRLEADVDPRNQASARLLERLGFRPEGLLRERWIVAGEVSDSAVYGLLRAEWDGVTP